MSTAQREPPAGSPAAPLRGGFYAVAPGREAIEHFAPDLTGMSAAISRAAWLSAGGPQQQVLVHHHRRPGTVLFEYADGRCTRRPECVIPAGQITRKDTAS